MKNSKKKNTADTQNKIPIKHRLGMRLGISDDLISGSLIELRGRCRLTLEGCGHIEKYDTDEIILGLKDSSVSIRGTELTCIAYYAGAVGIEGYINSVIFTDSAEYEALSALAVKVACKEAEGSGEYIRDEKR